MCGNIINKYSDLTKPQVIHSTKQCSHHVSVLCNVYLAAIITLTYVDKQALVTRGLY